MKEDNGEVGWERKEYIKGRGKWERRVKLWRKEWGNHKKKDNRNIKTILAIYFTVSSTQMGYIFGL